MKIRIRAMGAADAIAQLEKSTAADAVGGIRNGLFLEADWPSPGLASLFDQLPDGLLLDLNPWMVFTKKEIDGARFLNMRPGKILRETDADYEANRAHVDSLPWHGHDAPFRCRLPQALTLSDVRLNPLQVGVVGHWSAEYIVSGKIRDLIAVAGLGGVDFRPVSNRRTGKDFDDFVQLYTDRLLAPRVVDLSSPEIRSADPAERGYDMLGSFCYSPDVLDDAADFNRVGEASTGFEFGDWVVSQAVRHLVLSNGIKGLRFEPVLEDGSAAYAAYLQLWRDLFAAVPEGCTVRGVDVGTLRS